MLEASLVHPPSSSETWNLHIGLRLGTSNNGIISLPRYHTSEAYLKHKFDVEFNLIYIDSIYIAAQHRNSGLGTRLLHILCTANDKSPRPLDIGLVACPSAGSGMTIGDLDAWYERRGFIYDRDTELLIRRIGDKRIHKVVAKYNSFNNV